MQTFHNESEKGRNDRELTELDLELKTSVSEAGGPILAEQQKLNISMFSSVYNHRKIRFLVFSLI